MTLRGGIERWGNHSNITRSYLFDRRKKNGGQFHELNRVWKKEKKDVKVSFVNGIVSKKRGKIYSARGSSLNGLEGISNGRKALRFISLYFYLGLFELPFVNEEDREFSLGKGGKESTENRKIGLRVSVARLNQPQKPRNCKVRWPTT